MKFNFKFLIICLLVFQTKLFAGKNQALVAELKNRTLLVEIQEEEESVIKELKKNWKKPKQLEDYKKGITDFNRHIKQTIQKYWSFNKSVEYKTRSEIASIRENEKEASKYAYFDFEYIPHYESSTKKFLIETGYFKLFLGGKSKCILSLPLYKTNSKEVEIVYAIKQMNSFLKEFELGNKPEKINVANSQRLMGKTIIIDSLKADSALMASPNTDLPFKVMFANTSLIETKIVTGENGYAILLFIYASAGKATKRVVLLEDFNYAAEVKANGTDVEKISKITFSDLTEIAAQIH